MWMPRCISTRVPMPCRSIRCRSKISILKQYAWIFAQTLQSDITVDDLKQAVEVAGVDIRPRDTVLLYMAHYDRTFGTPAFLTDFPGLVKASAEWLGRKGIVAFGVEAVSPGRPGKHNFEVHLVCRDMGFTHHEGLTNLEGGRQRALQVHRLPAQDSRRHRQSGACRGGTGRVRLGNLYRL